MKDLLAAIKLEIQKSAALGYVRDSDIFITENELLLPEALMFPAIGIKDGAIAYKVATQSQENDTLLVKVIAYVQLAKPEAAIMGDEMTGLKGILDVGKDIRGVLKGNRLSGLADAAWPESETESAILMGDEIQAIQMKILTIRYERY
jgi:hypothetical protein